MTHAEIQGKPIGRGSEDLLTSEVFQSLKNIDRKLCLKKFLKIIGLKTNKRELEDATFEFWKTFSEDGNPDLNTEPDVIIELKKTLIFVECKYRSGFQKNQLKKEYYQGIRNSNGRDFYLLGLTANYDEPDEIKKVRESLKKDKDISRVLGDKKYDGSTLKWTSWQELWTIFKEICESGDPKVDNPSRRMAEDIKELLEYKGLRGYMGFNVKESEIKEAIETLEKTTKEFQILIKELIPRLEKKGIIKDPKNTEDRIERDGGSRSMNYPYQEWITYYYAYPFVSHEFKGKLNDAFLFINLNMDEPFVEVGCSLQINRKKSAKFSGSKNTFYHNFFSGFAWKWEDSDLLQDMEKERDDIVIVNANGEDYLTLSTRFEFEELTEAGSIKAIINEFVDYQKFVQKAAKELEVRSK